MSKRRKLDRLRSMSEAAKESYDIKPARPEDLLVVEEGCIPIRQVMADPVLREKYAHRVYGGLFPQHGSKWEPGQVVRVRA